MRSEYCDVESNSHATERESRAKKQREFLETGRSKEKKWIVQRKIQLYRHRIEHKIPYVRSISYKHNLRIYIWGPER